MATSERSGPAPAAAHALEVLRLLSTHVEPMPAAAIARELGLPRSSTYKLLGVLLDREFVTRLPEERRYGLGVAAFEVGSAYSRQGGLARLARPLLARLVDETTHNTHLAVLHGADVLYLVEQRAPRRPVLVTDVGVRLPAHLTASGLALLARLPAAQVRALYPDASAFAQLRTRGPTRLSELRAELREVRRRGHALELETVGAGLASVASAAVDHGGHPVAAVAVTYPNDVADDRVAELAAAAARAAAELTRRIGGQAPRPRTTGGAGTDRARAASKT